MNETMEMEMRRGQLVPPLRPLREVAALGTDAEIREWTAEWRRRNPDGSDAAAVLDLPRDFRRRVYNLTFFGYY